MSVSPVRLNHAVLFVADLERAVQFYTQVFGMVVAAREPRASAAFLRLPRSGNHHDLGLFGIGSGGGPKRRGVGLYHLAWQLDTSTRSPPHVMPWSPPAPTPASPAKARPRASTAPIPTTTPSRSCGCCLATPGTPTRTPLRS